jgi:hypothetical protein
MDSSKVTRHYFGENRLFPKVFSLQFTAVAGHPTPHTTQTGRFLWVTIPQRGSVTYCFHFAETHPAAC